LRGSRKGRVRVQSGLSFRFVAMAMKIEASAHPPERQVGTVRPIASTGLRVVCAFGNTRKPAFGLGFLRGSLWFAIACRVALLTLRGAPSSRAALRIAMTASLRNHHRIPTMAARAIALGSSFDAGQLEISPIPNHCLGSPPPPPANGRSTTRPHLCDLRSARRGQIHDGPP